MLLKPFEGIAFVLLLVALASELTGAVDISDWLGQEIEAYKTKANWHHRKAILANLVAEREKLGDLGNQQAKYDEFIEVGLADLFRDLKEEVEEAKKYKYYYKATQEIAQELVSEGPDLALGNMESYIKKKVAWQKRKDKWSSFVKLIGVCIKQDEKFAKMKRYLIKDLLEQFRVVFAYDADYSSLVQSTITDILFVLSYIPNII